MSQILLELAFSSLVSFYAKAKKSFLVDLEWSLCWLKNSSYVNVVYAYCCGRLLALGMSHTNRVCNLLVNSNYRRERSSKVLVLQWRIAELGTG